MKTAPSSNTHPRAQRRILIVDDDPSIRAVLGDGLEALGYSLSCCADAEEALVQLRNGDIDMLLTDFQLPLMTGVELALQTRKSNTASHIILMTGYMRKMDDNEMRLNAIDLILEKPFSLEHLAGAIKTALSRQSDSY